ncbi:MAG: hypothetical protein F6J97_12490 [Leptolyngbya sp. SIO4C1]|nr:hypothetical protein [Leptolyngbya sp. SIO4C1]
MTHSFLIEPGRWTLQGNWLERDARPMPVKGKILVAWNRDYWFTMVNKLMFPDSELDDVSLQYKGRLTASDRQYTFVLQHSVLGRVEGEGWIAPDSIVQRYWVLGDRQRRTGFETLYRLSDCKYHFSSSIMAGHYLTSTMEAVVERRSD